MVSKVAVVEFDGDIQESFERAHECMRSDIETCDVFIFWLIETLGDGYAASWAVYM